MRFAHFLFIDETRFLRGFAYCEVGLIEPLVPPGTTKVEYPNQPPSGSYRLADDNATLVPCDPPPPP